MCNNLSLKFVVLIFGDIEQQIFYVPATFRLAKKSLVKSTHGKLKYNLIYKKKTNKSFYELFFEITEKIFYYRNTFAINLFIFIYLFCWNLYNKTFMETSEC